MTVKTMEKFYCVCPSCHIFSSIFEGECVSSFAVPIEHIIKESLESVCPVCETKQILISAGDPRLKDRAVRLEVGRSHETFFDEHWTLRYRKKFGPLEIKDFGQYASNPDRYCERLRLFIEIKSKSYTRDFIENNRTDSGMLHLNKRSIDFKTEQQRRDSENVYALAVFLEDAGWYCVSVLETSRCEFGKYEGAVSGSGDTFYRVPLKLFRPLHEVIEKRAKELGLL